MIKIYIARNASENEGGYNKITVVIMGYKITVVTRRLCKVNYKKRIDASVMAWANRTLFVLFVWNKPETQA